MVNILYTELVLLLNYQVSKRFITLKEAHALSQVTVPCLMGVTRRSVPFVTLYGVTAAIHLYLTVPNKKLYLSMFHPTHSPDSC
jgi:hypothetical protein